MIRKHKGLLTAEAVLNLMNTMELSEDVQKNAYVEAFDNCREQGYVINYWNVGRKIDHELYIAFAENRSSDNIVVYVYQKKAFPQNMPAPDQWDNKKYFAYNEHYQAAEYIRDVLERHASTEVAEKQNV